MKRDRKQAKEARWRVYSAIPIGDWAEMAGRPQHVVKDQARRSGIPFGDATISLPAVVRGIHDFLTANKYIRLRRADGSAPEPDAQPAGSGDPDLDDYSQFSSPQLERYRKHKADMAELELGEKRGQLVPVAEVRASLARVSSRLRSAGEAIGRQFGSEAQDLLDTALSELAGEFAAEPEQDHGAKPEPARKPKRKRKVKRP